MKVIAVMLGPSGVGLVGLYVSTIGLIGTVTKLGLGESGVRDIAAASAQDGSDQKRVEQTAAVLGRLCWYSGIAGWVATAVLAWPLSLWIFESKEYVLPLAILGVVVLIESLSSNYNAVLRGLGKIVDLAKIQMASGLVSTAVALLIYWRLGEDGILPVIIATALITLGVNWLYARRLHLPRVSVSADVFVKMSRSLLRLGALFTFVTVLASMVGLAIRSIIIRELGLEASGYFQAATALTSLLGGFMIQAMVTDLYPRLAASIHDVAQVNRLVNEQIQTGILIVAPLMCMILAFRETAIELVYSKSFGPAVALIPWFLAGVLLQVIIVPMEFVARAKAHVGWLSITQSVTHLSQLLMVALFTAKFGLMVAGYAALVALLIQTFLSYAAASWITGFRMAPESIRKYFLGTCFFLAPLVAEFVSTGTAGTLLRLLIVAVCCFWAAYQIAGLFGGMRGVLAKLRPGSPL
jgi:PST family polysaccharide transporter